MLSGTQALRNIRFSASHVDMSERRLVGVKGAESVIEELNTRKTVTRLLLGQNLLGDTGTEHLFDYLSSPDGRRFEIADISLNVNKVGDIGLRAIARYLADDNAGGCAVRELFLQGNSFTSDPETVSTFVSALNKSQVTRLNITTNNTLSDAFLFEFLPNLHSPTLQTLQLSAIGLTSLSCDTIVSFLTSCSYSSYETSGDGRDDKPTRRACPVLQYLSLNANHLGFKAIKKIVRTIVRDNFTVSNLELYSNCFVDVDEPLIPHIPAWVVLPPNQPPALATPTPVTAPVPDTHIPSPASTSSGTTSVLSDTDQTDEEEDEEEDPDDERTTMSKWQECTTELKTALIRNSLLTTRVHEESLRLLRASRPVLLRASSSSASSAPSAPATSPPSSPSPEAGASTPLPTRTRTPTLPVELILDILTLHAGPTLSPSQRSRIFRYAEDPTTLPPDPRILPRLPKVLNPPKLKTSYGPYGTPTRKGSLSGKYSVTMPQAKRKMSDSMLVEIEGMEGPVTTRTRKRAEWYKEVGCVCYERH